MKKNAAIFFFLIFGFNHSKAQLTNTVQFKLLHGIYNKPIKPSNVKVIVNDSVVKYLVSDKKGLTGFLEVPDGTYNFIVSIPEYKEMEVKKYKIKGNGANGKHIKLKLSKDGSSEEKDKTK